MGENELDLEAIKAREAAATPGPWVVNEDGCCVYEATYGSTAAVLDAAVAQVDHGGWTPHPADAEFIAAARSDIPALIQEVERLRAESERLRHHLNPEKP